MKYLSVTEFKKLNNLEKVQTLKKIAQGQIRIIEDRRKQCQKLM